MPEAKFRDLQSQDSSFLGSREVEGDMTISLLPFLKIIIRYWQIIVAITITVLALGLGISVFRVAFSNYTSVSILQFKLVFQGAEKDEYPNGSKFQVNEIISPLIIEKVYSNIGLTNKYISLSEFQNGFSVAKTSEELELLSLEYRAKMQDPKISAIDKDRIQAEYYARRKALDVATYTLMYNAKLGSQPLPRAILDKALLSILSTWAARATTQNGATKLAVDRLSTDFFALQNDAKDGSIAALDATRRGSFQLKNIVEQLENMPQIRFSSSYGSTHSIAEIGYEIRNMLLPEIDKMFFTMANGNGLVHTFADLRFLESRAWRTKQQVLDSDNRIKALGDALSAYEGKAQQSSALNVREIASSVANQREFQTTDSGRNMGSLNSLNPQLGESFLQKIIDISSDKDRLAFREKMAEQISAEGMKRAVLVQDAQFYEELLRIFKSTTSSNATLVASNVSIDRIILKLNDLLKKVNTITAQADMEVFDSSVGLYSLTSSVSHAKSGGISFSSNMLFIVASTFFALFMAVFGCLMHGLFGSKKKQPELRGNNSPNSVYL